MLQCTVHAPDMQKHKTAVARQSEVGVRCVELSSRSLSALYTRQLLEGVKAPSNVSDTI